MPWAHLDIAGIGVGRRQALRGQGRQRLRRPAARGARPQHGAGDGLRSLRRPRADAAAPSATSPRREVAPVAEELDRDEGVPVRDRRRSWASSDLMGIPFPEEYGGAGGDSLAYALAVEELTRVDSSVAITMCAHTSLGTQPVYLFGSEEQKRALAARPAAGRKLGRVRADRARGRAPTPATRRRARRSTAASGRSTAPSSSSPTPGTDISGPWCAITAGTAGEAGDRRDLQPDRRERHAGLRAGRAVPQDGLERVGHAAADVHRLPRAGGEPARPARRRASSSSCTCSTSGASGSRRWASGSRRARWTRRWRTPRSAARSASRSRSSRRSRPSSPTCRREIEAARLLTYKAAC